MFFLRTFDGFSFLVSMLKEVFLDLKHFLLFYTFIIIMFGLMFWVLQITANDYEGLIFPLGYIIMAFRESLGDSEVDNFKNKHGIILYLSWMIWCLSILTAQIVLMNFIIAVIGQSYEKVMQKSKARSY